MLALLQQLLQLLHHQFAKITWHVHQWRKVIVLILLSLIIVLDCVKSVQLHSQPGRNGLIAPPNARVLGSSHDNGNVLQLSIQHPNAKAIYKKKKNAKDSTTATVHGRNTLNVNLPMQMQPVALEQCHVCECVMYQKTAMLSTKRKSNVKLIALANGVTGRNMELAQLLVEQAKLHVIESVHMDSNA